MCHIATKAVFVATVARFTKLLRCCRMLIYQRCPKTTSQRLKVFLVGGFMVCISRWQDCYFIRICCYGILFCTLECPRGHPYLVGDVSVFTFYHNWQVSNCFMWHCTVWGSCSAKHMQCVWCYHWRTWFETGTRQQRCEKVSFNQWLCNSSCGTKYFAC